MQLKRTPSLVIYDLVNGFNQSREIEYETFTFSGGEVHIKIKGEPRTNRTRIDCRINNSDDLMRLILCVDALRRMNIKYIEVAIPYIPYARQDRVMVSGEPLSIKVFASILNSLKLDKVICYDIHNETTLALFDNIENVSNWQAIGSFLITHIGTENWNDLALISPDAGSYKKIFKVCSDLKKHWLPEDIKYPDKIILCNKLRDLDTGKIIHTEIGGDVSGKNCLILDDIIDGGRTFNDLASVLRDEGAKDLYLFASHGIFSHGYDELLNNFKMIGTTNSIRDEYPEQIKVIKLEI